MEPIMTNTTDLLTRSEAAEYLRVSRWYLDTAGAEGPPYMRIGRLIRYRRADIDHWLALNTVTSAAVPALH